MESSIKNTKQKSERKEKRGQFLQPKRKQEQIIMWTLVGVGSVCSLWVVFYVIWKTMEIKMDLNKLMRSHWFWIYLFVIVLSGY